MIIEIIVFIILEILFLLLLIPAEKSFKKKWDENKNKINIALIVFLLSYQLAVAYTIASLLIAELNFSIGYLGIEYILALLGIVIQLNFLLYLKQLKKLTTLPIILAFYIGALMVVVDNVLIFPIFASIVGVIALVIFTIEGKKNHNGTVFSLGFFLFIYGISVIVGITVLAGLIRLISALILLAGTSGFLDRYFLIDKEQERKIQNVWIARMVIKEER